MEIPNKLFTFFICFFTILSATFAQGDLTGKILDPQEEPIPFANVVLLQKADSGLVSGSASDVDGNFSIPTPAGGQYFLKVTALGFRPMYSLVFKVGSQSLNKEFGTIALEENTELLSEVSVEALRSRIVNQGDKMVVNLEGTAMAAGSDAYQMLQETPGVWVNQDGDLQLNGKSGVKVMINGRDTYLSGEELQKRLKAISSENLKSIEVIANPSAKYEAEGTAGILNLVLKTNTTTGFHGSVFGSYNLSAVDVYSTGADLNYRKDKLNVQANLNYGLSGHWREMEWYREFHQPGNMAIFTQEGEEVNRNLSPSGRVAVDYQLAPGQNIGAVANISKVNGNQDWNTVGTLVDTNAATDVLIDSRNNINNRSFDQNYNLYYSLKLDSSKSEITANLDYVRLTNYMNSSFLNIYNYMHHDLVESEELTADNPYSYEISAARLDYVKPLPNLKAKLEMGAKASRVVSDNNIEFYEELDSHREPLHELSNSFTYVERILAGYTSFSMPLGEKWSVQAGLRAEHTSSLGTSGTLGQENERNYLNWFPSLFVQQKISGNYQLSYSYSRRISRPPYDRLNPFVFYVDPYTSIQGNPDLRPQYTDAVQVTQTFLKKYNLILGYDYTVDFLSEVPRLNVEEKSTVIGHGNIDKFENLSATLVVPVQIGKNAAINNTVSSAFQDFETVIDGDFYNNSRFFFMARTSATIKLPKDVVMEASATYRGPVAHGVYRINDQWGMNLGLKRSFLNEKLDVSLTARDIFRTMRVSGTTGLGENTALIDQYFGQQSIGISVRYDFSKGEEFKGTKRNVELEELQRAGG